VVEVEVDNKAVELEQDLLEVVVLLYLQDLHIQFQLELVVLEQYT
jgi:hypothetical protein